MCCFCFCFYFLSILTVWFTSSSDMWSGIPSTWYNPLSPERLHMQHCVFPPSWAPQGDALEQGHHPEGICGLHPQITEGTAALQRPGEPPAVPGASQPKPAAPNSGMWGNGEGDCNFLQVKQRENWPVFPLGSWTQIKVEVKSNEHTINKNIRTPGTLGCPPCL